MASVMGTTGNRTFTQEVIHTTGQAVTGLIDSDIVTPSESNWLKDAWNNTLKKENESMQQEIDEFENEQAKTRLIMIGAVVLSILVIIVGN